MPTGEGAKTKDGLNGSDYHRSHTVEDVTKRNVHTIIKLEESAKIIGPNRCMADMFVWVHMIWFGAWVILNVLPGIPHFDLFPFTFLTLVVSLEAIFLSTFILISQNHETRLSERRNQLDLQINLLTEQENTKMLKLVEPIAEKVGAVTNDDLTLQVLEQANSSRKVG